MESPDFNLVQHLLSPLHIYQFVAQVKAHVP